MDKNEKICGKCHKKLPNTYFFKDKKTLDGLYYYCKKCSSLNRMINHQKHKKKDILYGLKYVEKNKLKNKISSQEIYARTNPKRCFRCKKVFSSINFWIKRRDPSGLDTYCKFCRMDEQYQKLYRITLKDYNKLLINQNNKCFICGGVDDKKTLSVDHDHRTGKVRGLLCIRCNRLLGYARDNPTILHSAELYLLSRI